MLPKQWSVAPTAPDGLLRKYRDMSPILAQVLYNRGFIDPDDAGNFLYNKSKHDDPFLMKDMQKAVDRIQQAIRDEELIEVYGDFDADGVTSTTLLAQVLRALKANVRPYIPHRVDEGYGLNSEALQNLAYEGVKLVITVDCGIRSVAEIEAGKAAGLDIIVTDHHSIGPEIPDAYAVINPKQADCPYPEDMLAGVGVAFKLADALLPRKYSRKRLLDLVALGTVADIMPLNRPENRALVRRGLEVINKARRPGIRALLDVAGIPPGQVTTTGIGFGLGPRLNAAGRLDTAMVAYALLSANNQADAERYAACLQDLNIRRQDLTRNAQELIREYLERDGAQDAPLIFYGHTEFEAGIVGLVAGRITEEFYRPTIILEEGKEESRASCRSIPQFDITQALDRCADLLIRHGGHALAAGFTVHNENVPALRDRLMALAEDALDGQVLVPQLEIDAEVDIHRLSADMVTEFQMLEPTGYGNEQPLLMSPNVRVLECRTVGSDGRHLKLRLARAGQPPLDAIGFGLGEWADHIPDVIDTAYYLEINEWNGRASLQMNLQDIRPAGNQSP